VEDLAERALTDFAAQFEMAPLAQAPW
jgi:hypothetical protein